MPMRCAAQDSANHGTHIVWKGNALRRFGRSKRARSSRPPFVDEGRGCCAVDMTVTRNPYTSSAAPTCPQRMDERVMWVVILGCVPPSSIRFQCCFSAHIRAAGASAPGSTELRSTDVR